MCSNSATRREPPWHRFVLGVAWLALVTGSLQVLTGLGFWVIFAGVLGSALISGGLALWWLGLWASRPGFRLGQFGIGSLLFLTVFVALYLGAARWLTDAAQWNVPSTGNHVRAASSSGSFVSVTVLLFILAASSIPACLAVTEGVLWAAVWLVQRRAVQTVLAAIRRALRP